jgi:predicted small lipoprotein YifL
MNKFAVAFAAATLMSLAACGEKPAAETNNATNEVVVNEAENAANAAENAANVASNAANTATNAAANAAE